MSAEPSPPASTVTERVDALLAWFRLEGRDWPWRRTRDRWTILVSEVCLQQTQVARAATHIERLLERYPTSADMASAPLADVLELWQGLGYPRRARNLWLTAQQVAEHGWPSDFRVLPGIGPYTDAALRCFADEEAILPPDINTRRVVGRLFPEGAPSADQTPAVSSQAWAWGQAVMELGQRPCRAKARCDECPVSSLCPSYGTIDVVASPRQARYAGSMRERRGNLLRALTTDGQAPWDLDAEAAESLVADGLASRACEIGRDGDGGDGELLLPIRG